METYELIYTGGLREKIRKPSLLEAKKYATSLLSYGNGVTIYDNQGDMLAYKEFEKCGNNFGWSVWKNK